MSQYLTSHPSKDLHGQIVLMRASLRRPALMNAEKRRTVINETLALQHPDGGWGVASLGSWPREGGFTER
jgi:hypothetical protein